MRASRAKVDALQDTQTTTGTCESASCRACASAPARGGSNTTASKRASSGPSSGRRNRSRVSIGDGAEPLRARRHGAVQRQHRRAFDSTHGRSPSRRAAARSVPTPAKRSATILALPTRRRHEPAQRILAGLRRLQEAARRAARRGPCPSAPDGGRRSTMTSPWMESRARSSCVGEQSEAAPRRGRGRAVAAHIDVEAALRRRDLDVQRLRRTGQRLARWRAPRRARGRGRASAAGRRRRDDVMRARGHEAGLDHRLAVARHAAGVEGDAAAACAMGRDQRLDCRVDAGWRSGVDEAFALPGRDRACRRRRAASRSRRRRPKSGQNGATRSGEASPP